MDDKSHSPSNLQPSTTFDTPQTSTYLPSIRSITSTLPSPLNSRHTMHYSPPSRTASGGAMAPAWMGNEGNLISPEEPIRDSFRRTSPGVPMPSKSGMGPSRAPISPPISPDTPFIDPRERSNGITDPILYPSRDASGSQSPPHQPLFGENSMAVVASHVAASRAEFEPLGVAPPQTEEYLEALEFKSRMFKSQVMAPYISNPQSWLSRERNQLAEDLMERRGLSYTPRPQSRPQSRHMAIAPRPVKANAPTAVPRAVAKVSRPAATRVNTAGKVTKPTREKKPRKEHGEGQIRQFTQSTREDKDFNSVPDYCPPTSTLPENPNCLKVEWKGQLLSMENDSLRDVLPPQELLLASILRLDGATYLTSKRRMFLSRLECLKKGKDFRKTDAQQACKIDVNKASKLWTAYEKVGWLDPKYMLGYLNDPAANNLPQ